MRLIDADALEKYIADIIPQKTFSPYGKGVLDILTHLKNHIRTEMPSVEAEPVRHGYWMFHEQKNGYLWKCSKCKGNFDQQYSYCPHCGAKMDGGAEDVT